MSTEFIKICFLYLLLQPLVFHSFLVAQSSVNEQVSDTINCRNVKGQSYALYQPARYDNKKSWPVILIFDPGGRGRTGINSFIEAGRNYGFILACSNNSHNGPLADNFIAAAAMVEDLEERFNIDQRRIYTAGFSGGSRFAVTFAEHENNISGVIGCGAGLPGDRNLLPAGNSDFLYFGLAGNRDMNYLEMNELSAYFTNRTKVVFYLRTFSGGHQWPGPVLLTEAVEWLILNEMIRKIIPSDDTFIKNAEKKTEALINSAVSAGNISDAIRYMRAAIRDFPGTSFASGLVKKMTESENLPEYKTAMRKWSKVVSTERESEEKYLSYIEMIANSGSVPDSAALWFAIEIRSLNRMRDKGSPENSQMASRVMNFMSILCSEQGSSFYRNKLYAQAGLMYEICTLSDSQNPNNYYNLARSLAQSSKPKKAVDALTDAVDHGFNSLKTIESDPAFRQIRSENRYKALIGRIK